jgi:isoleucyl-tRNA synthetase
MPRPPTTTSRAGSPSAGSCSSPDARELARAVQDLRRDAGLELDDRIELWTSSLPDVVAAHLPSVATDTLATLADGDAPADASRATVELDGGSVEIALRRATGVRQ